MDFVRRKVRILTRFLVKVLKNAGARGPIGTTYDKQVAPASNIDIQPFFNLAQVLVALAAEIG